MFDATGFAVCTCTFMYLTVTLTYDYQLWAKSIDQARELYKASAVVHNQGDAIGVLVGGPKRYVLSDQQQHEIANMCSVPDDEVQDSATSYRSVWKPTHGYNGLLYRVNENAIVVSRRDGEVVVQLQKILRVPVSD